MDLILLCVLVILGGFVGFIAGLLGVGGGGIMVPVLSAIFLWQGVDADDVVHLALGTSMATIIGTSLASVRAHHKNHSVLWYTVGWMAPGIFIGTSVATYLAAQISGVYLAIFFAVLMFCVSIQMFFGAQPLPTRQLPHGSVMSLVGVLFGGISALGSIGGGSLGVPYFYWHNVPLIRAIGTSAALGFPIAVFGTLGYVIHGYNVDSSIEHTFGFIYLPGVLVISLVSFLCAPLGVKVASYLPLQTLKKVFAFLLIALSVTMLWSLISG